MAECFVVYAFNKNKHNQLLPNTRPLTLVRSGGTGHGGSPRPASIAPAAPSLSRSRRRRVVINRRAAVAASKVAGRPSNADMRADRSARGRPAPECFAINSLQRMERDYQAALVDLEKVRKTD